MDLEVMLSELNATFDANTSAKQNKVPHFLTIFKRYESVISSEISSNLWNVLGDKTEQKILFMSHYIE